MSTRESRWFFAAAIVFVLFILQILVPLHTLNTSSILYIQTQYLMIHYCKDQACLDLRDGQQLTVLAKCVYRDNVPIFDQCFYWQAYPVDMNDYDPKR